MKSCSKGILYCRLCGTAMMARAGKEDDPQARCYVCAGNRLPGQPPLPGAANGLSGPVVASLLGHRSTKMIDEHYSRANDGVHGTQLWQTDGTAAGTLMVKDIFPVSGNTSYPNQLTSFDGALYFVSDDGVHGAELWRSDGTAAGTVMVKDINPSGSSFPFDLTPLGDQLLFQANDGSNTTQLWPSDGTTAGTTLVKAIGPSNQGILWITDVGGIAYFTASDGVHGNELWQSDGAMTGTFMVADQFPGPHGSYPKCLTNVDGTLFFAATDGVHGYELFKLPAASDDSGGNSQDRVLQPHSVFHPASRQATDSGSAAAILFQDALAQRAPGPPLPSPLYPRAAHSAIVTAFSTELLAGNHLSESARTFLANLAHAQRPNRSTWPDIMLVDALFRGLGEF